MSSSWHNSKFWNEVDETCDSLNATQLNIYLPSDIEAHLHHTTTGTSQLCAYRSNLRAALQTAEPLFDQHDDACEVNKPLRALDSKLGAVEDHLRSVVASLELLSNALRDSTSIRTELRRDVEETEKNALDTTSFVEEVLLSDNAAAALKLSDPHSEEFKDALEDLSRTLKSCNLHKDSQIVLDTCPTMLTLRDSVIRRIEERFAQSLKLMRNSPSSFMVLRETLLREQRPLIKFLSNHWKSALASLSTEYIEMAKLAFKFYMDSHCRLLKPGTSNEEVAAWNLSFMGHSTSKVLASIWDYASTNSASPEVSGDAADRHNIHDAHQKEMDLRDEINCLLNDYCDKVRECMRPVEEAEFRLQVCASGYPAYDLLRKLAAFFLSYERSESHFVIETFGQNGATFLSDIFSHKNNPALAFLEESIETLALGSELEELLLCLYVCRRFRERIADQQGFDSRVIFFVVTDRTIQTRLVSLLEGKAMKAKELLAEGRKRRWQGFAEIARFFSFVSNLLVIAHEGDKLIRSQDVGHALRRRLHSWLATVLAHGHDVLQRIDEDVFEIELHLRYVTGLLFALDVSASWEPQDITGDIRRLVEESFFQGCKAFAGYYADRNLKEISQLESPVPGMSLDESAKQIAVLTCKLRQTKSLVADSMNFLADDDVGDAYKNRAVQSIVACLRISTEALGNILSHNSQLSYTLDW